MDKTIPKLRVPGIDCIIHQDHREIFRHQAGCANLEEKTPVRPGSLYNLYSGTKMITCVAALQLVEQGEMLLTDPLHLYLPEYRDMRVKHGTFVIVPAQKPIRIIDLFTMTAGLSYELDTPSMRALMAETGGDFSTRDFVRALAKEPLLFEPGEGWNYSYCHDVLAAVIEVVSGMSFGEYLKKNIFAPLGMTDTGFSVPEEKMDRLAPQYEYQMDTASVRRIPGNCLGAAGKRHESGGGGLISSAEDYILFIDAMACGGVGKSGARIISEQGIALMSTNHLHGKAMEDFGKSGVPEGYGYGMGVGVIMDSAAAHTMVPEGAFYWGGIGGVQNMIDTKRKLAYFVGMHCVSFPKPLLSPYMLNIVFSSL